MNKKHVSYGLKIACAVGITAAAVATTFKTTDVVASASAPTGSCALVMTQGAVGNTVGSDTTGAFIGTVAFGGNFAIDLQNVTGSNSPTTTLSTASGTTSVGAVRASGAYPVTFTGTEVNNGQSSQFTNVLAFLPSNNNQTYLVTSLKQNSSGGSFTGVCQVQ